MVQHGSTYNLLRKLKSIPYGDVEVLPPRNFRQLVHDRVKDNLKQAHVQNEFQYNIRSRAVQFRPGQEVFRRSFARSKFSKNFNAKLGKQWIKARIAERVGNCLYKLEDLQGKPIENTYHAKDLKQ